MPMPKRIAGTGGSGRLGSQVIKELMAHEYEVKALDIKANETSDFPGLRNV